MFGLSYQKNLKFQPDQALFLLISQILSETLILFYVLIRNKYIMQKNITDIMFLHEICFIGINMLLLMKFKGLSSLCDKEKLIRAAGGSLYGACHFGVLYNIFDRNYEHLGFWNSVIMCVYLGQQSFQLLVLSFGFKLRSNIEAMRASNVSPLKSLILNDILCTLISFILAVLIKWIWGFQWAAFSLLATLGCLGTKIISCFVLQMLFIKRYRTKHTYEFIKTSQK